MRLSGFDLTLLIMSRRKTRKVMPTCTHLSRQRTGQLDSELAVQSFVDLS